MTRADKWRERKCVLDYWAYKDELNLAVSQTGYFVDGVLSVIFLLAPPKSWSKKKRREFLGKPHRQKPDLDNLIKGFKDALLKDDSIVYSYVQCGKYWWPEDKIIVYSDGDDLDEFPRQPSLLCNPGQEGEGDLRKEGCVL